MTQVAVNAKNVFLVMSPKGGGRDVLIQSERVWFGGELKPAPDAEGVGEDSEDDTGEESPGGGSYRWGNTGVWKGKVLSVLPRVSQGDIEAWSALDGSVGSESEYSGGSVWIKRVGDVFAVWPKAGLASVVNADVSSFSLEGGGALSFQGDGGDVYFAPVGPESLGEVADTSVGWGAFFSRSRGEGVQGLVVPENVPDGAFVKANNFDGANWVEAEYSVRLTSVLDRKDLEDGSTLWVISGEGHAFASGYGVELEDAVSKDFAVLLPIYGEYDREGVFILRTLRGEAAPEEGRSVKVPVVGYRQ